MAHIHPTAFIHDTAVVLGDVTLGAHSSIWPTAVLRADGAPITIGADSNVQDGAVLHVDDDVPCTIGERVTIGHRAIVHGATVESDALIGMGAIVLNRAVIGAGSMVGAGALVTEGTIVPPGSLVLGVPGRVVKQLTAEQRAQVAGGAPHYVENARRHGAGHYPRHRSP